MIVDGCSHISVTMILCFIKYAPFAIIEELRQRFNTVYPIEYSDRGCIMTERLDMVTSNPPFKYLDQDVFRHEDLLW